jgi:chromosome partitioning protein
VIISIINEKGGVGKTTLTTNLAAAYQRMGKTVLLVDSDPQGSLRDWHAAAGENNTHPPVVAMDRAVQFKDLAGLAANYDIVLIDGAPSVQELAVAAIKASHVVLIPVQPSPYDIWAAESLVQLVKARQELGAALKAAFIVSRQIVGTKLAGDVREALEGYGLPILSNGTCQRIAYPTSAAKGGTVFDVEPNGAGAGEIDALAHEMLELSK